MAVKTYFLNRIENARKAARENTSEAILELGLVPAAHAHETVVTVANVLDGEVATKWLRALKSIVVAADDTLAAIKQTAVRLDQIAPKVGEKKAERRALASARKAVNDMAKAEAAKTAKKSKKAKSKKS